jgi:hypothetical protein
MRKSLLALLILCSILPAQDITISKDSIRVYNNPIMEMADWVIFTSHTSTAIHLDSAYVRIDEMDTVGLGHPGVEFSWKSNVPLGQEFVWLIDTAGQDSHRLIKTTYYPSSAEPLSFSGADTTDEIFMLEIGYCFQCELFPKLVRYFRGSLKLFFSNGQIITIKLKSFDMRTSVRQGNLVSVRDKGQSNTTKHRCLVNGRRVAESGLTGRQMRARVIVGGD